MASRRYLLGPGDDNSLSFLQKDEIEIKTISPREKILKIVKLEFKGGCPVAESREDIRLRRSTSQRK